MTRSVRPRAMTPPRAEGTAIDEAALARTAGGDPRLARELLHIFYGDVLPDALVIAAGAPTGTRRKLAHRLKGAALTVGAGRLAELAERLVAESGEGDAGAAGAFAAEARAVAAEIERRLDETEP